VALLPLQSPEAVQELALELDHVTVEEPFQMTEVGLVEMLVTVAGQELKGGVSAEQEPLHWMVPELVCPQALGDDEQLFP